MFDLIFCLVVFIILYLFYLLTIIIRKKALDKFIEGAEVTYLKKRYNLKLKKVNKKGLANIIALTNSFIVSVTLLIALTLSSNFILMLLIAFIVFIPLILILYHLIGINLRKKEL